MGIIPLTPRLSTTTAEFPATCLQLPVSGISSAGIFEPLSLFSVLDVFKVQTSCILTTAAERSRLTTHLA